MHAAQGTSSSRPEPPNATYFQPFGSRLASEKEGEAELPQSKGPQAQAIRTHEWQGWLVVSRSRGYGGQDSS